MRPQYIGDDTVVATGKTIIKSLVLCAGSGNATLTIYNSPALTSDATKIAFKISAAANTSASYEAPIYLDAGCFALLTGEGASATISQ
jgi:hypothetical protein